MHFPPTDHNEVSLRGRAHLTGFLGPLLGILKKYADDGKEGPEVCARLIWPNLAPCVRAVSSHAHRLEEIVLPTTRRCPHTSPEDPACHQTAARISTVCPYYHAKGELALMGLLGIQTFLDVPQTGLFTFWEKQELAKLPQSQERSRLLMEINGGQRPRGRSRHWLEGAR